MAFLNVQCKSIFIPISSFLFFLFHFIKEKNWTATKTLTPLLIPLKPSCGKLANNVVAWFPVADCLVLVDLRGFSTKQSCSLNKLLPSQRSFIFLAIYFSSNLAYFSSNLARGIWKSLYNWEVHDKVYFYCVLLTHRPAKLSTRATNK